MIVRQQLDYRSVIGKLSHYVSTSHHDVYRLGLDGSNEQHRLWDSIHTLHRSRPYRLSSMN